MKTIKTLFAVGLFFAMFVYVQSEEKKSKTKVIKTEKLVSRNDSIKSSPASSKFNYQKAILAKY